MEAARLANDVNRSLKGRAIEKLYKPFETVAARQANGEVVVFNRGKAGVAVGALASVPQYFWPVVIRREALVDGGMASRAPSALAPEMGADVVVEDNILRPPAANAQAADVVIRLQAIRSRIDDFQHRKANIDAGEAAGHSPVAAIQARLQKAARAKSGPDYGSSTAL